jgi:hypothetical protein
MMRASRGFQSGLALVPPPAPPISTHNSSSQAIGISSPRFLSTNSGQAGRSRSASLKCRPFPPPAALTRSVAKAYLSSLGALFPLTLLQTRAPSVCPTGSTTSHLRFTTSAMTRLAADLPLAFLILLSVALTCVADTAQELLDQLPQCSKLCMTLWAISVGCSPSDIACQCGAPPPDPDGEYVACLLGSCGETELNRTYVTMLPTFHVYAIAGSRRRTSQVCKDFECASERDADGVVRRA